MRKDPYMRETRGTNIEVKKNNRNHIFRYLCAQTQTVSNPEIASALSMSLPTVTANTREFIEQGLVRETGELASTGGRRAKALRVAAETGLALGLDITKNHIGLALADLTGSCLAYERIHFPFAHTEDYYRRAGQELEAFFDRCQSRQTELSRSRILGLGISFPGIVDLTMQEITYSHVLGLHAIPFAEVTRYFPYPCQLLNDANAGAYAAGMHAKMPERFFYLSLSNTVGGAVFHHGTLVQGSSFRCGEAGHMTIHPGGRKCYCGKLGCLDAYCAAGILSDAAGGSLEQFFEYLDAGDVKMTALWEVYTSDLAMAVNNILMILDCDVMLGGYVGSRIGAHIEQVREKAAGRNTFSEDGGYIRACSGGNRTAAMGAALGIIETFLEKI